MQTELVDDTVYETTLNPTTEEEYSRLPCFVHCLQLVVNYGIKASTQASSSLKKVASLAKLAHNSTVCADQLEEEKSILLYQKLIVLDGTVNFKQLKRKFSIFHLQHLIQF